MSIGRQPLPSMVGRIYNRLFAATPDRPERLYTKGYVKIHKVAPAIIEANVEFAVQNETQELPAPDRIAYSYKKHAKPELETLQQTFNRKLQDCNENAANLKKFEEQLTRRTTAFRANPYRRALATSIEITQRSIAVTVGEQRRMTQELLHARDEYYTARYGTAKPGGVQRSRRSRTISSLASEDSATEEDHAEISTASSSRAVGRAIQGNRIRRWLGSRRYTSHEPAIITSFEPLGDSADVVGMGNAGASGINIPAGAKEIGTNVPTDYIGAAVALSSIESCLSFHKEIQRLSATIKNVAELKKIMGDHPSLQCMDHFLRHERKTAKFCKYIPGLSSGTSGALSVVGQFVGPISPISLFLSAANSVAHVGDTTRQLHYNAKARLALKTEMGISPQPSESAEIEERHLMKERRLLNLARLSWGGIAVGAATLGVASSGALGLGIAHAAPVLLPVGIAVATPGIVGATVWNNMVYGKRFTPGLSQQVEKHIAAILEAKRQGNDDEADRLLQAIPTEEILKQELLASETKHQVSKAFRREALPTIRPSERALITTRKVAQSILSSVTLGMMETKMHHMEKKIHEHVVRVVSIDEGGRRAALDALQQSPLGDECPLVSATPQHASVALIDAIDANDRARLKITQLIAARTLREKVSLQKSKQAKRLVYAQRYDRLAELDGLLPHADALPQRELGDLLKPLLLPSSGPSGEHDAHALLQRFRELHALSSGTDLPEQREMQTTLSHLIKEATDEYLLYHVPVEAKIQRGTATRMLSSWRQTRPIAVR